MNKVWLQCLKEPASNSVCGLFGGGQGVYSVCECVYLSFLLKGVPDAAGNELIIHKKLTEKLWVVTITREMWKIFVELEGNADSGDNSQCLSSDTNIEESNFKQYLFHQIKKI